jgi:Na+:H+ antiporter, NhaA family
MPFQMKASKLFTEFFESEKASGVILLFCTAAALLIANSPVGKIYLDFWHVKVGFELGGIHLRYSLEHWINDGLMAIFFLVVGLEIERELYTGELANRKNALLPIFAAVGGMLMPALFYVLFTHGTIAQAGFGIPMATDIAFTLGALSLLGRRVPLVLKVFLTAFAIIDDLGAIAVIAIFYTTNFSLIYLILALAIFAGLVVMNRLGVNRLAFYLIPGVVMWYLIYQSGIHAAISGVLLAFAIPFRGGINTCCSARLEHALNRPVALIIMPLFALANTGVMVSLGSMANLFTPITIGILAGLFIGKPLGIVLFSTLAVKVRISELPRGMSYRHLIGVGFLGGIGFTMSIFITLLAFGDTALASTSKIAIMLASLAAGGVGLLILSRSVSVVLKKKLAIP